ncbi:MAG TPA: tetratricopeptide repeat protein [Ktedonobacteraceae bacterium]|nr:tetratricopeptide repeat protein [Ktedonobacteraceae bacterium]
MSRRYPQKDLFTDAGKLIVLLTHSVAKTQDWTLKRTMKHIGEQTGRSSDMVYRWQEGHTLPKPETIKVLAQLGHSKGGLSREWCEELLDATHYPDPITLLNELYGAKELKTIPHRLPSQEHTRLIGREEEIKKLLKYLSPHHAAPLIPVDGIGGVGKTSLVLDVAYQCLRASTGEIVNPNIPIFDAIIFVSAKQQLLTAQGIRERYHTHGTLSKICNEVIVTLERYGIKANPSQDQLELVREALAYQRTLLIVDNMETMEDKQTIMSFLYELPPSVKVVVTTREQQSVYTPIRLEQLEEEAALELIKQQAEEKQVKLSPKEIAMLYERIGGIPAALVYAVGQRAAGYSIETVLKNVPKAGGDVARFCFQSSVETLRGQPAHAMLMAFALFPRMPLRSAVSYVAGLEDPLIADEALAQLQRLSLIREFNDRFRMLSLTREYAMAELMANRAFEEQAYERWIEWYQKFTRQYGGHDMGEWHLKYDHLDEEWENLLAVFDWCAAHDRYDEIKSFWCAEVPGSVVDFTHLYGYWDDRLAWLEWLRDAAGGRGDWPTMLDAIASIVNTHALMDHNDDAEDLFKRGQKLNSYGDPTVQVRLLVNHTYLYIFMERFDEAKQLLDQARELVPKLQEPLRTRYTVNIDYNYGATLYWEGDYAGARAAFTQAMKEADSFGWQSLANNARNYLADIERIEGHYDEAERLLEAGLTLSERNKDKRRTNAYKRSLAYLRQKQGRWEESLKFAQEAREGFERLSMEHEVERMDKLIKELRSHFNSHRKEKEPVGSTK